MGKKCLTHKLERIGDGQFGTAWSYKCDHDKLEECFKDDFFSSAIGNLMAGDTIRVVEFQMNKVTAFCELMVISIRDKNIICRPVQNHIVRFQEKEPEKLIKPKETDEEFIHGDGEVKWNLGRQRHVVTVAGVEVASSRNKEEAQAIARGDKPLPV